MSANTSIEWTEATWNVVTGCTRVSAGCEHCYIETTPPFRMDHRRFNGSGIGATTGVKLHSERLHIPLKWRKPKRIFVCSLADLFQDEVPDAFIAEVFAVMALAPQHTFQVLTKRHARMRSLLSSPEFQHQVGAAMANRSVGADKPKSRRPIVAWPLPNVWVGVSAEDQQWAATRVHALLATPAAVRWVSAEPLLGAINLRRLQVRSNTFIDALAGDVLTESGEIYAACPSALDWIVAGGESGPGARPMLPDWPVAIQRQCEETGTAFLFKQWGEWCPADQMPEDTWSWLDSRINLGQEPHPDPHRVGKKRAGRLLDGRTWDEYPAVPS